MKPIQKKCGTCKWLRPRTDGKPFWHGGEVMTIVERFCAEKGIKLRDDPA